MFFRWLDKKSFRSSHITSFKFSIYSYYWYYSSLPVRLLVYLSSPLNTQPPKNDDQPPTSFCISIYFLLSYSSASTRSSSSRSRSSLSNVPITVDCNSASTLTDFVWRISSFLSYLVGNLRNLRCVYNDSGMVMVSIYLSLIIRSWL